MMMMMTTTKTVTKPTHVRLAMIFLLTVSMLSLSIFPTFVDGFAAAKPSCPRLQQQEQQVDTSSSAKHTTQRREFFNQFAKAAVGSAAFVVLGGVGFGAPAIANAYPRRDVGKEGERSGITEAFNEQAYKTNNRLEASGFPLDTVEQEQQRINEAMSTFSYDDIAGATSPSKNKKKSKAQSQQK